MSDTKKQIMDIAEHLFAEKGFGAVSLRQIMSKAGVNPAAIHYHFGSKEALIEAVLNRKVTPLNKERMRLLDELENKDNLPNTEQLISAFIGPALRLSDSPGPSGSVFMKLMGRAYQEAGEGAQKLLMEQFGPVLDRYSTALKKSIPSLSKEDFAWRFHFFIGALAYTMADHNILRWLLEQPEGNIDTEKAVSELVAFAATGLRGKA